MGLMLALAGAAPAVALMWYVGRFDRARPEPAALLRKVAVWGGLAVLPALPVELLLAELGPKGGAAGALWTAFVVAGLTEEGFKALTLWWVAWRHPAFDERVDGVVYATRAGLGFALVENVAYLLSEPAGGVLVMFLARAVLAVPMHAITAGYLGAFAARRRFDGTGPGLWGGLGVAVLLHGAYDAGLFLAPVAVESGWSLLALPLVLVPLAVVAFGYQGLHTLVVRAQARDDEAAHRAHGAATARLGFSLDGH